MNNQNIVEQVATEGFKNGHVESTWCVVISTSRRANCQREPRFLYSGRGRGITLSAFMCRLGVDRNFAMKGLDKPS